MDRLRDQPELLTLKSLVAATGLHENTVREHLASLVRRGFVRRHLAEPVGRGRPAWLYEMIDDDPRGSDYPALAVALADEIARTEEDPVQAAAVAGEKWGRELARDRGASPDLPCDGRKEVLSLLDDLGFAPKSVAQHPAEIHLTRCPLLETAYREEEVVCAIHLNLVRGALDEYGSDPSGSTLKAFSEPGACTLVIPPAGGRGS